MELQPGQFVKIFGVGILGWSPLAMEGQSRIKPGPVMLRASTLITLVLLASPATAFDTQTLDQVGSMLLRDLMPLIDGTPRLEREVAQALTESRRQENEVTCLGRRFSSEWGCLAARRVSPYLCEFAEDKWLYIRATVALDEKEFKSSTQRDEPCAEAVTETDLKWEWSPVWIDP